jgi:hypothetical protein
VINNSHMTSAETSGLILEDVRTRLTERGVAPQILSDME